MIGEASPYEYLGRPVRLDGTQPPGLIVMIAADPPYVVMHPLGATYFADNPAVKVGTEHADGFRPDLSGGFVEGDIPPEAIPEVSE